MEVWTIKKLLDWITEYLNRHGVDSPRLSAELLLCHVLGFARIELYTLYDHVVQQPQLGRLHELVKRASRHEPIAYLVGRCEFYSLSLKVTPDCLIPRPETEQLVDRAVEFLRPRRGPQRVGDLCTGCGCIAAAVAKNCPQARIIATDLSDAALAVAAENLQRHHLEDRVTLLCGDLFDPIIRELDGVPFDLIVSNPPYVSEADYEHLERPVKNYEPKAALYGGRDGLDLYRRIAGSCGSFLKPDGALMLEIGCAQGAAVRDLLEQTGLFDEIAVLKDPAQHDRIVMALRRTGAT